MESPKVRKLCIFALRSYMNVDGLSKYTDEYFEENYGILLDYMQENYEKLQSTNHSPGVLSIVEGNMSVSFSSKTESIHLPKNLLPTPRVRLF